MRDANKLSDGRLWQGSGAEGRIDNVLTILERHDITAPEAMLNADRSLWKTLPTWSRLERFRNDNRAFTSGFSEQEKAALKDELRVLRSVIVVLWLTEPFRLEGDFRCKSVRR